MKSASLKHQFRNVEAALKDATDRGDGEAVGLLVKVRQTGEFMLAQEIGDVIDSNWIDVLGGDTAGRGRTARPGPVAHANRGRPDQRTLRPE